MTGPRPILTLLALLSAGELSGQSEPGAAERAIRAAREQSNAAIARHDTAGVAATFAPGIVSVASTSSVAIGRDPLARALADQFAARPDVVYRRTPTAINAFAPWRMASEEGRWEGSWTDRDGPVRVGGRYFAKWRMLGGTWLIESETFVPERCKGGAYCRAAP